MFNWLCHVSSTIHTNLKMISEDLVPQIYKLLPDEAIAATMTPEDITKYMRNKVVCWQNDLYCFHQGSEMGADGKVCIIPQLFLMKSDHV